MSYKGPNEKGLSVLDAVSNKISEEYPNEKIYDNKKTTVNLVITNNETNDYHVELNFKSYKGELNYDWNVNLESRDIRGENPAKHPAASFSGVNCGFWFMFYACDSNVLSSWC